MDKFNSNKLKELRKLNHMSQKQLGNLLGISDRAISKWESGLSKPSGENLIYLAKIFLNGESLTYSCTVENSDIATGVVSGTKLTVTGVKSGITTATIKIGDSKEQTITITVREKSNNNGWL